jgi:hypothetical protein
MAVAISAAAVVASASAADTPKPGVKLIRDASGTNAQTAEEPPKQEEPVRMEKVEVSESKLPASPRPLVEKARSRFSPVDGGPFFTRKAGKLEISIGLWRHGEVFEEEARFKPPKAHAEFDLLRIKW